METKQIKANAIRKLKEFWRLARIAGADISIDRNYIIHVTKINDEDYYTDGWRRKAPEEFKIIIETINNLNDIRYRKALILRYVEYGLKSKEIMSRMKLKSAQYHNIKSQALLEFAKYYRDGWLETYTEQK